MPGNDYPNSRPDHPDGPDQRRVSRRSLLGAAGVGAVGLAAGAFGGLAAAQAATAGKPAASSHPQAAAGTGAAGTDERPSADEHVVVHVHAGSGGDIDVYRGTSQTRVQDPDLAARLRRTAG
jgi:hypothetical protein